MQRHNKVLLSSAKIKTSGNLKVHRESAVSNGSGWGEFLVLTPQAWEGEKAPWVKCAQSPTTVLLDILKVFLVLFHTLLLLTPKVSPVFVRWNCRASVDVALFILEMNFNIIWPSVSHWLYVRYSMLHATLQCARDKTSVSKLGKWLTSLVKKQYGQSFQGNKGCFWTQCYTSMGPVLQRRNISVQG